MGLIQSFIVCILFYDGILGVGYMQTQYCSPAFSHRPDTTFTSLQRNSHSFATELYNIDVCLTVISPSSVGERVAII